MGDIYKNGFERGIQNGGITTIGSWRRGLALDGAGFATYGFTVTGGSNANPYENVQNAWSRDGSRIKPGGLQWGIWTADSQQTIGALDVELPDGGGGWTPWFRIDGGDYPQQVDNGAEVTAEIEDSPSPVGTKDFVNAGLAELILDGLSNTTVYYVLLDGGTPIGGGATINEGGGAPSWTYTSTGAEFSAGSDATFNNSSGGDWNVTGIEVRANSETGPTIMSDSVSATVANGGSITFTSITLTVNGLS